MSKPITPDEAHAAKPSTIPDAVFDVFNTLLTERSWGRLSVTITQEEVVALLLKAKPPLSKDEIFARHWLDIESAYEAAGWKVEYDKPGYNESYEPSWTFAPRRKNE